MSTDSRITRITEQQRRAALRCIRLLAVDELWPENHSAKAVDKTARKLVEAILVVIASAHAEDNLAAFIEGMLGGDYGSPGQPKARDVLLTRADRFQYNRANPDWTTIGEVYPEDYPHTYDPADDYTEAPRHDPYKPETRRRFEAEQPALDAEKLRQFGRAVRSESTRCDPWSYKHRLADLFAHLDAAREQQAV